MQATAKSLKSIKVDISVNTKGIKEAAAALKQLQQTHQQFQKTAAANAKTAAATQIAAARAQTVAAQGAARAQATANIAAARAQAVATQAAARAQSALIRANAVQANVQANQMRAQAAATAAQANLINAQTRARAVPPAPAAGGAGRGGRVAGGAIAAAGGAIIGGAQTGIRELLGAGLIYQLGHMIGKAVIEGTKQTDTGFTSLELKQLDRTFGPRADEAAQLALRRQQAVSGQRLGGAFFSEGERAEMFSEAIGIARVPGTWVKDATKPGGKSFRTAAETLLKGTPSEQYAKSLGPDFRPAAELTGELEEMTRILVALGKTEEQAKEQTLAYAKALEQSGRLTDPVTGQFDPEKMHQNFNFLRQMMPTIGREMTGTFSQGLMKYLRSDKYTVSDRAFGAVLLLGEEMGTSAAVGYHQAVKQLSGQGQKLSKLNYLAQEGLLVPEYGPPSKKGKRKIVGGTAIDEDLLRTDMPSWINKHLLPILEREGGQKFDQLVKTGKVKGTLEELAAQRARFVEGYSNDATKIAALANKVAGDRTAIESIAGLLGRSQEIQSQLDEAFARSGSIEDMRKATAFSVNVAAAQLGNQFKGAAGLMVKAAAPWLVPQMTAASQKLSDFSTQFVTDPKTGLMKYPSPEEFAKAATAFIPLGLGGSLLAMTQAKSPSEFALAGSAAALFSAGMALQGAADAMTELFTGKKPDTLLPTEGVPATLAQDDYVKALNDSRKAEKDLKDATESRNKLEKPYTGPGQTRNQALANENRRIAIENADARVAAAKEAVERAQTDLKIAQGKLTAQQTYDFKLAQEQAQRRANFDEYRRLMDKVEGGGKLTKSEQRKVRAEREREAREERAATKRAKEVEKAVKGGLLPREKPPIPPEVAIDPSKPVTVTTDKPIETQPAREAVPTTVTTDKPVPAVPATTTTATTTPPGTIPGGLGDLASLPSRLAEVFQTGKDGIATAGTTMGENAASVLRGAASGIGSTIGSTAAAALQAAASHITINATVTQKGGGVDTGARPAPGGGD